MTEGYIFDYGGTIDTEGCHWGMKIWHAYERLNLPIQEKMYRDAYVFGERTLGKNPIIKPHFTFLQTLKEKIKLQTEYLAQQEQLQQQGLHWRK